MITKGDYVALIDEDLQGEVIAVDANEVLLETSDGFQLRFPIQAVVKINTTTIEVYTSDVKAALTEKEPQKKKKPTPKRTKQTPALEVDLHIEKLTNSTKNLSNFDMLNIQLDTAKQQLDFAIYKRMQRVVFIHGVGQGVLRQELETMLRRYDNIKFYEASYQQYGAGATEVYIFQNP